jgi:hypothetical protein
MRNILFGDNTPIGPHGILTIYLYLPYASERNLIFDMQVDKLTTRALRLAIWRNQASFPAQVPVFEKHTRPDVQWRLVQLYFVRRWSFVELARRYGVTPQRVMQIVRIWRMRAIALGYIQEIPAENPIQTVT